MNDSILKTIKQMIGASLDEEAFDIEIISYINSVLFVLNQIGLGPELPLIVSGYDTTWGDFDKEIHKIALVKTYIALKVRLVFDPPQSSTVLESINNQISECEWRLNSFADFKKG